MNWKIFIAIFAIASAIILLSFNLNTNTLGFNDNYAKLWKQVENHEKNKLPKSAKEVVDKIYDKASKADNHPQKVKALIHKFKYIQQLDRVENPKIFSMLESEVEQATAPTKNLLHSMIAELYWQYLQQNRHKFYNRTETVAFDNDDILTWSLEKIYKTIINHHNKALQNNAIIKRTKVDEFEPVITLSKDEGKNLRPTLYDFIANRAIDFFKNDESSITKPIYTFVLNEASVFDETKNFINEKYESKDDLSNKLFALKIYQDLESFHKNDNDKKVLIETTLQRLQFAHNNAVLGNKDDLYENALKNIIQKYSNSTESTQAGFYLANLYLQKSRNYSAHEKPEFGKYKKMAKDVCDKAIEKFANSYGSKKCKNLLIQIESKNLAVQIEEANNPNENLRALVSYQNINKIYCKVVKLNKNEYEEINNSRWDTKERINFLNRLQVIKNWNENLPSSEDLLNHSLEIKVENLPIGYYYLLVSTDSDFSYQKNAVAFNHFWVTKYAIVEKSFRGDFNFYVVDRKSGKAISDVKLNLYQREYNRRNRMNEYKFVQSVFSDTQGIAKVNSKGKHQQYKVAVEDENDFYTFNANINNRDHNYERQPHEVVKFFTDRSIYRPGQKVYFKGIAYTTHINKHQLSKNKSYEVKVLDVNRQEVKIETFVTNNYGSFNGSFVLPESGLTGVFTIQTQGGQAQISVEEYKRPKFEVVFDTIKESYSLNDLVKLKGFAKTYSGANLDNVKVEYIVERTANFPYFWGWFCGFSPWFRSEKMIVANGETTTNENGKFEIGFLAKPDLSLKEENKPVFNYQVTAKVVDSTGETQEKTTTVKAGYIALDVSMKTPNVVNKNDKEKSEITVATKNLNGAFESTNLNIEISKLQEPKSLLRERYWQRPDEFLFTENEYVRLFPNDIYDNESKYFEWKVDKTVQNKNERSTKNYTLPIDAKKLKAGKYKVVLKTKDKNRKEIEIAQYFDVIDERTKTPTLNEYFSAKAIEVKVLPNETAKLLVNTNANNLFLHLYKELKNELIDVEYDFLNQEQKVYKENVTKNHIGDFVIGVWTIKNNRYYEQIQTFTVPFENKENLEFEWLTFRDKLEPNQNEEWQLKIKGKDKEKVALELLTTMYDASLDAFKPHNYNFALHNVRNYSKLQLVSSGFRNSQGTSYYKNWNDDRIRIDNRSYNRFDWQGFSIYNNYGNVMMAESAGGFRNKGRRMMAKSAAPMAMDMNADAAAMDEVTISSLGKKSVSGYAAETSGVSSDDSNQNQKPKTDFSDVVARGKLVETAFFKPDLKTDKEGNVIVSFKSPETLTKWKLYGFAHSTDLDFGLFEKEIRTQKDLMITPNAPRFFREDDKITFTAKVNNISDKPMNGTAILQLFDALTDKQIDGNLGNSYNERSFNINAGASKSFEWNLQIPKNVEAVKYKVLAKAGNKSDGEQNILPVLKNRMMVTESLPLPLRSKQKKTFVFDKFKNNRSTTLNNYSYTLEFTSNPAWYAVQALPYLMDYPNDCAEQIFSRIYANALATEIANSQPKIKAVFDEWKNNDSDALLSNLEKNQELKMLLLNETPWVMEAKDESERKKRIALLFDLNKMSKEYNYEVEKLKKLQKPDGGFGWFNGMRSNRYITQHIVSGFGKLNHLNVKKIKEDNELYDVIKEAIKFLDYELKEDYERLKRSSTKLSDKHVSNIHLHYFYGRSFFKDIEIPQGCKVAYDYYFNQAEKYWTSFGFYQQGMIALALHRNGKFTEMITKSLLENMLEDEELGMFFKYPKGYYWHQAPIESQAMMVEVFSEITKDTKTVDELKVWLLKQKQVQDWKTTKATVEAIYALLLRGENWIAETKQVEIKLGGKKFDPFKNGITKAEAGTGYFKTKWFDEEVDKNLATIAVENPNNNLVWGSAYWQYFENLDKITFSETPLKLKKKLFKQIKTDTGFKTQEITKNKLKVGDKVIVRIELRVDRTMNYVHMKDMRSAGFEPVNVISSYKYQDGLGYYESTKDASTDFFFDVLREGTYVFEYALKVYHKGDFSNGITSIQCMYAPEFTSHSEGVRVLVE